MQVLEAPPDTDAPVVPGPDGNLRVVIVSPVDIRSKDDPIRTKFKPEWAELNAAQCLRDTYDKAGGKLLGAQAHRLACTCGNGCTNWQWGLVMPRTEKNIEISVRLAIGMFAFEVEETDDPDIKVGVFTMDYMEPEDGKSA